MLFHLAVQHTLSQIIPSTAGQATPYGLDICSDTFENLVISSVEKSQMMCLLQQYFCSAWICHSLHCQFKCKRIETLIHFLILQMAQQGKKSILNKTIIIFTHPAIGIEQKLDIQNPFQLLSVILKWKFYSEFGICQGLWLSFKIPTSLLGSRWFGNQTSAHLRYFQAQSVKKTRWHMVK